jgi:hypothetical protein
VEQGSRAWRGISYIWCILQPDLPRRDDSSVLDWVGAEVEEKAGRLLSGLAAVWTLMSLIRRE